MREKQRRTSPIVGTRNRVGRALIAILAVGGLYLALPANLTVGPRWLFPAIVIALLIPTVISHRTGKHNLNKLFGFTVTGVVTAAMIASVVLLIRALPSHKESPTELLISAAALWFTNILVFACGTGVWMPEAHIAGIHGRAILREHFSFRK